MRDEYLKQAKDLRAEETRLRDMSVNAKQESDELAERAKTFELRADIHGELAEIVEDRAASLDGSELT